MKGLGLLAGLAAILAGLVIAGGETLISERMARANQAMDQAGAPVSLGGTPPSAGFFAGAGLTSPL